MSNKPKYAMKVAERSGVGWQWNDAVDAAEAELRSEGYLPVMAVPICDANKATEAVVVIAKRKE